MNLKSKYTTIRRGTNYTGTNWGFGDMPKITVDLEEYINTGDNLTGNLKIKNSKCDKEYEQIIPLT